MQEAVGTLDSCLLLPKPFRTKVSDGPMGKSWLAKKGGWTKVDVGDDLLNSDEFGFVELEQLDASELGEGRRGRGRSVCVPPQSCSMRWWRIFISKMKM